MRPRRPYRIYVILVLYRAHVMCMCARSLLQYEVVHFFHNLFFIENFPELLIFGMSLLQNAEMLISIGFPAVTSL